MFNISWGLKMVFQNSEIDNLNYIKPLALRINLLFIKIDGLIYPYEIAEGNSDEFQLNKDKFYELISELKVYIESLEREISLHPVDLSSIIQGFIENISLIEDSKVVSRIFDNFRFYFLDFHREVESSFGELVLNGYKTFVNVVANHAKDLSVYFGGLNILYKSRENEKDEIKKLTNLFNGLEERYKINYENESGDFKTKIDDLVQKFNDELSVIRAAFKLNIEDQANILKNNIATVDNDFKNTVKDFEMLKKFINAKGELEVTDHYKKKATTESRTYWAMTVLTFGVIILSITLALKGLNEYKEKSDISVDKMLVKYKDQPVEKIEKINNAVQRSALTYLILRLVFSLLLFSTIIYTSRIAYRAYIHMRHSENMMLKLATLRPFINQLDEAERNQIHKDLVPDYFGKDAGMVDGVNEKFKDLPANVSAVAMKAIEQIGSGGGSSEGKNDKKEEA